MVLGKIFRQSPKGGNNNKNAEEGKRLSDEVDAFFKITSAINERKNLDTLLELIARESLTCLKAHRSTVFVTDEKNGILKTQFTFASDPLVEQVGLFEEKEVTRKVFKQKKPFLLKEPKDFAEFFKYGDREWKITSLMSIPLSSPEGSLVGVLSLVLVNEGRRFNDKDLQFLSIFGSHVSISLEIKHLEEELQKGASFRKDYEGYLDNILNQLVGLGEEERRRTEEHIGKLLPNVEFVEERSNELQNEEEEKGEELIGVITLTGELDANSQQQGIAGKKIQVEFEDDSFDSPDSLLSGGVFIRTENPLDLGEQFPLKLHLTDGKGPIAVDCKVIWTNKYGYETKALRRGMGVKFLNLEPKVQRRVAEHIFAQKGKMNAAVLNG